MNIKVESFKYDDYEVLKNINMNFNQGKITLLLGQSGCGKSTLLNIISDKQEYSISYATQDIRLIEKFSVLDNVTLGLENIDQKKLQSNAEILGVIDLLDKKSSLLSGGERQRVTILRALMNEASYILLDEPTSNLDQHNGKNLLLMLEELVRLNNVGVIITSHESYVKDFCDVIYEYDNCNFIITKGELEAHFEEVNRHNKLLAIEKIRFKYYMKYFLNNLVFKICLLIVMLVSSFLLLGINSYFQNDYDLYYDSLDSNTIVIEKQYAMTTCEEEKCTTSYDFSDITFSEEELQYLSNLEGVSTVSVSGKNSSLNMDSEGNKISTGLVPEEFFSDPRLDYLVEIRKEIIRKTKDYREFTTDSSVNYRFVTVNEDVNTINGYGYSSDYYHLNNIMYGTNELNESNDIIIPYSLALYISDVSGVDIDDIIGETILIPVQNFETGEKSTKEYNVVGIYDETNTKSTGELGNVYIKGTPDLSSEYLYQQLVSSFGSNKNFTSLYPDLNTFKELNDTGITTVVLTIDENYETIYNEIITTYTNANIITKEQFKEEYFVEYKLRATIFSIITFMITIMLFVFLCLIITRLFINKKSNDIRVFSIIGYSSKSIKKLYKVMLMYDLFLCFICSILLVHSPIIILLFVIALVTLNFMKLRR